MCVSACVFMCMDVSVCEHLQEFLVSQSLSINLSFLYQSFFSPSMSFSTLLHPCAARCPRVRFPVVGPTVSPLPYLLKMLPLLVSWADSRAQRRGVLPWSRERLIPLVTAGVLSCPNLLANLVDSAQVRVVHQLHEVPVPKLLIGHWGTSSAAGI